MARSDLVNEITDELSRELANEIDREILWGFLEADGWTKVTISRFTDNYHAVDIRYWIEEYTKGRHLSSGVKFLFEDEKDATMFILRWVESDPNRY